MKYWDEKNKRIITQAEKEAAEKNTETMKNSSRTEETYEEKKPVKKSRK